MNGSWLVQGRASKDEDQWPQWLVKYNQSRGMEHGRVEDWGSGSASR
jgi:hypothetical protein